MKVRLAIPLFLLPSLALPQTSPVAPQPANIDGATSYVYKSIGKDELRLHVFSGSGNTTTPKPAIVFFFGGGWQFGSVTQFATQAAYLAQRGMVAIVADYRVFSRHGTTPFEAMTDAKSAVRWIRAHAAKLGVDANRIAAAGGSAGGHIALSAAVFDTFDEPAEDKTVSSKPNALVLFNPAVDCTAATPPVLKERFGDRGRDASPLHHLHAGLPPMLILHGVADAMVPYTDVQRFCADARTRGNECQLQGYEGAPHGFFNERNEGGKWYRATLLEADQFLTKLGYLPKPAPNQIP